jgi:hypothetical protein
MKVLNVLPLLSARAGGPQYFAAEAARALAMIGVESTILASDLASVPKGLNARRVRQDELPEVADIDVRLFETRQPHRLAYAPALRSELRRRLRGTT